ncbi:ABC transporter substrate-binding protein [Paenibacillus sp. Marseille-Q4541]|uniref:ABC transporter substrate-binding protein n=1 Tax=Paenibacillus sp. Marseille-Q4541 TaxID=2831522 RepID=UPI001BAA56DD|nr:ABC transporter substrate-binding protein [Paenibacillus sp. Marseille-Q4541]
MWKKSGKRSGKSVKVGALFIALSMALTACGGGNGGVQDSNNASPATEPASKTSVKVVLNWFAKTEHGGFYAAKEDGIYDDKNLDVTIEPGGPQVSSIQIVASGKAEFGVAHADQILLARKEGIPIVALATTFQISPQALMYHEGSGISDFGDLNGRTVFIQQGQPYWEYIKHKYKLDTVKEVAYTGQHGNFIEDTQSASQSFVNGEPFVVEKQGIKVDTKLIADSGYRPYAAVIYTTEKYLKENPEAVKAFIGGTVEGWNDYKENYEKINKKINEVNTNLAEDEIAFGEEAQREYVYGYDAEEHGVGYMTEERWLELMNQLMEIGLLDQEIDVKTVFTTDYLPEH